MTVKKENVKKRKFKTKKQKDKCVILKLIIKWKYILENIKYYIEEIKHNKKTKRNIY